MSDIEHLKSEFIRLNGYWSDALGRTLALDPHFFAAYLAFADLPHNAHSLDQKTRDIILIAANSSVTHINEAALRGHMLSALGNGATEQEILEVLQIVSVLGIHAYMLGAPILMQEIRASNLEGELITPESRAATEGVKDRFRKSRGFWSELQNDMADAGPTFFETYRAYSSVPWEKGTLAPKLRELIYVAIDVSTTHLHADGTRIHLRNALRLGAHPQEVVEVIELVSTIGFQSWIVGTEVLRTVLQEKAGRSGQQ